MVDLFSGIGGFSLAADWTWGEECEHVCFVEIDKFCQKVLNKHWPNVPLVEDVNDLERIVAYAGCQRQERTGQQTERFEECDDGTATYSQSSDDIGKFGEVSRKDEQQETKRQEEWISKSCRTDRRGIDLLTAGFPCPPVSCAGKRKGTEDSRWLWPQTLAVIRAIKPRWVLLENVFGLLTIESGLLFENLCLELEHEGYSVLPLVVPAAGIGAPHRRDRIWLVAKSIESGTRDNQREACCEGRRTFEDRGTSIRQDNRAISTGRIDSTDSHCSQLLLHGVTKVRTVRNIAK